VKIILHHLGFAALLFGALQPALAEVPSSAFGHIAAIDMPAVSPDGGHVAAVLNTGEFPAVVVTEFGSTELTTILRLEDRRDRIESVVWANTDRLIVTVLSSRSVRGRPYEYQKMHALDKDGSGLKEITSIITSRSQGDPADTIAVDRLGSRVSRVVPGGARILSLLPYDSNRILVELFDMRARSYFVYKLNIYDNDIEKLLIGQKDSRQWVIDANQEISLSYSFDDPKKAVIHEYRDFYSGKWTEYRIDPYVESETFVPLLVSDGRALVLSNHQTGLESLWAYDYEGQRFVEPVFAHDRYDLSDVIWDSDQVSIIGVEFTDDKRTQIFFEERHVAALQTAKAMLPAFDVTIASMSRDASRIMVRASRSDSPPKYIWADIKKQVAGPWFSEYPELESIALRKTSEIAFVTSDGTELSGYLTMPDPASRERPPVVVYAHDGPQQRASRDFDPMVQLLANRGIAVLQVNHRGSAGFGLEFQEAGYRQWGERMQQTVPRANDHRHWRHCRRNGLRSRPSPAP
jgi:dipeptidyl aminopeptidase/acylaminoacyl peptidase